MYKQSCPLNETVLIFSYIIIKLLQNQMPYLTERFKALDPKDSNVSLFLGAELPVDKKVVGSF